MLATIRGIQEMDFVGSNGEHIQGANLFVSYADEGVVGERCERFFCRPEIEFPESMKIGSQVNIAFNHKGKVESVSAK